jgi:hypothetical protein
LWEKKSIEEAYAAPRALKRTARKYHIQTNQICKWQNNANTLMELPAYQTPHTVEEQSVIKAAKQNVTLQKRRPEMFSHDEALYILDFYEQLRERGIPVNSQLLTNELQRFSPQLNQVSVVILRRRVLCVMKNNNITHRCVMHKAQNIHFEQPIMDDFTHYINRQIVIGRYSADLILNMDETNVDFDPSPRTTLSRIGERSVNAHISGHSGWCIVILACTMSGIKLPAMVIWQGVPNGRIARELLGQLFACDNIKHTVQVWGWMDSDKYQLWVMEVL